MPKTIVLSLGGSLIVPDNVDINFLKWRKSKISEHAQKPLNKLERDSLLMYDWRFLTNFKKTIEKYIKKGYKFVIYCGGGKLARNLQQAASKITKLDNKDLDWLGIYTTKLNAQLMKAVFKDNAESFIVENPNTKINFKKNILIAAGWLPGWSTDYDAVLLAKNLGVKEIINMSDIDYVYDKDPKRHKNAKKIGKISWQNYSKLISNKWKAGMNVPFDPIAAKEAQKSRIRVSIIGKNLKNLENLLNVKKFRGTVIK